MVINMELSKDEVLSSEEQLKKQIVALYKINNITGFLPLNIAEMLPVIKKEMEDIFTGFECNFNVFAEKFNCHTLKTGQC
ncbi:MAG: histidine kinase, partial [Bacillota bacterium]